MCCIFSLTLFNITILFNVSIQTNSVDPDRTAHMSGLVRVLTFCLKTTEAFRRMTGEKTLVVIGALRVDSHFIRVCKYPDKQC